MPFCRAFARFVCVIPCLTAFYAAAPVFAQKPTAVRSIPPPGITISDADRTELAAEAEALGREITALRAELPKAHPPLVRYLPDVVIFHKAVSWAVKYDEFYNPKEIEVAHKLLAQGRKRASELRNGTAPWTSQTGLVVLGLSVQN